MIAIPASLLVTLAAMRVVGFTLDTVSLLAMTLIIGILVDDSIVVLENIERHHAEGEEPAPCRDQWLDANRRGGDRDHAGRRRRLSADLVPARLGRSFLARVRPRRHGRDADLALRLVYRHAGAGRTLVALLEVETVADRRPVRPWIRSRARLVRERALAWGLEHRALVVWIAFGSLVLALLLIPLGIVGFEYIPPVDRGEIFVTIDFPTGTPLTTTQQAVLRAERLVDRVADLQSETAIAGAYQGELSGYINNGAIGQIHLFLKDGRSHSTAYWATNLRSRIGRLLPGANVVAVPATDPSGGIAQPIDYVVSSLTADPGPTPLERTPHSPRRPARSMRRRPDRQRAASRSGVRTRERARARCEHRHGVDGRARRLWRRHGHAVHRAGRPQRRASDLSRERSDLARAIAAIPIRANNGSIVNVGDITKLVMSPAPPLIMRINRRNVV